MKTRISLIITLIVFILIGCKKSELINSFVTINGQTYTDKSFASYSNNFIKIGVGTYLSIYFPMNILLNHGIFQVNNYYFGNKDNILKLEVLYNGKTYIADSTSKTELKASVTSRNKGSYRIPTTWLKNNMNAQDSISFNANFYEPQLE